MRASEQIDSYIAGLPDWRGEMVARIRSLVLESAPELQEAWKWGAPVWAHNGLVCSASAFKKHVKLTFFKGASLSDPAGLFNAGFDAKTMRSIDFHEGDTIDAPATQALVREAVALHEADSG